MKVEDNKFGDSSTPGGEPETNNVVKHDVYSECVNLERPVAVQTGGSHTARNAGVTLRLLGENS